MGKRVLITGISSFLGARLAQVLEISDEVSYIAGIGWAEPPLALSRTEFHKADIRNPLIRRVVSATECDTVVHADLISNTAQMGGRSSQKERNVIGTMQLLAACQRAEHVKKVVIRSSSAVYGIDPSSPSVLTEDWSGKGAHYGYSSDVYDAEAYTRDFGRRRPDVTLTILRMTNILGPTAETNMTQFFSLPVIPTPLGFDPRLQFLHEDDAIEVLRLAVLEDHPGVFNVAADGVVYLSQAARIARRLQLPIPAQLASFVGGLVSRAGIVDFPSDQLTLIVHGRVIDNARLKETFGYEPKYSTVETLREFVATRGRDVVGPHLLAEIEERIYDAVVGR